jgi:hypothetical protein
MDESSLPSARRGGIVVASAETGMRFDARFQSLNLCQSPRMPVCGHFMHSKARNAKSYFC